MSISVITHDVESLMKVESADVNEVSVSMKRRASDVAYELHHMIQNAQRNRGVGVNDPSRWGLQGRAPATTSRKHGYERN